MRAPAGSTHFMLRIRILLIYFGYLGDEGTSRLHPLYAQNQDLLQSFQQAENHITQVRAQLHDREVRICCSEYY